MADIEHEVEAIKGVLKALEPLEPDVRSHVLAYVINRLGIRLPSGQQASEQRASEAKALPPQNTSAPPSAPIHISELKESKKPKSASEMAALVAYYLSNLAPASERRETVNTKTLETYFKIADYPLPTKIQFTLPNAKGAGYLDSMGNGEYKLNAVGHNLVVHSMPRADGTRTTRKPKAPSKKRHPARRK